MCLIPPPQYTTYVHAVKKNFHTRSVLRSALECIWFCLFFSCSCTVAATEEAGGKKTRTPTFLSTYFIVLVHICTSSLCLYHSTLRTALSCFMLGSIRLNGVLTRRRVVDCTMLSVMIVGKSAKLFRALRFLHLLYLIRIVVISAYRSNVYTLQSCISAHWISSYAYKPELFICSNV